MTSGPLLGFALALALPAPESVPAVTTPAAGVYWPVPLGHSAALLVGMRLTLSVIWPSHYDPLPVERSGRQFFRAYTLPPEFRRRRDLFESDGDPWALNVIGHGLFGSEVHQRFRQCGGSPLGALAFTAGVSAVWEFGIESFSQRPSAVDLFATPIIGMAIGEARYGALRWLRRRNPGVWRKLGQVLVDPFGELERGVLATRC